MTVRIQTFNPILNYTIAGTNASTSQAISQPPQNTTGGGSYANPSGYTGIQIVNFSPAVCFVAWSMGTATASTSGYAPVLASSTARYEMGIPATSVAVILGSATSGSVYVSIGDGA